MLCSMLTVLNSQLLRGIYFPIEEKEGLFSFCLHLLGFVHQHKYQAATAADCTFEIQQPLSK